MIATLQLSALALRARRSVMLYALISTVTGTTLAQQTSVRAELPTVKVGDRWRYEQNDRRTNVKEAEFDRQVTSVTDSQIEGVENGSKLVMTHELNIVESSAVLLISGESKELSFPLALGSKWAYKFNYSNKVNANKGRWQLDAAVIGYEKVKVPAGEFDAFKIEHTGFWNNDSSGRNGRMKRTIWFSPATRSIVKVEHEDGYSYWVRSLVEYQLQP